jgi:hypothetical protein
VVHDQDAAATANAAATTIRFPCVLNITASLAQLRLEAVPRPLNRADATLGSQDVRSIRHHTITTISRRV